MLPFERNNDYLELRRSSGSCAGPSFFGVDIDQEIFPACLNQAVNSCLADPAMPDKVSASAHIAQSRFSFDGFIQEILDHVSLDSYRKELGWWASPAVN